MAVVLKTTAPETVPGVRIPLPPPNLSGDHLPEVFVQIAADAERDVGHRERVRRDHVLRFAVSVAGSRVVNDAFACANPVEVVDYLRLVARRASLGRPRPIRSIRPST